MTSPDPAECHCGSISWERNIKENRYTCCSCKRPLWQPIETAPRDGMTILVYGHWAVAGDVRDLAFAYWDEDDQWWAFDGDEMMPTHWMPLPDLPKLD